MSTGQASQACLLNSACLRASGASPRHSAIHARVSSKRAGGFITRVALDECLDRSVTGRAHQFVPIAQNTERSRPKRQVVGENPAGDTISCGCGSTAECGRAKAERTVRLRSPAPLSGGVAHQQRCLRTATIDMERQRGQHAVGSPQGPPTIFRGHSSASQSG